MRVQIPEFQNKSDLYSYLKENKKKLISEKKQGVIYSDSIHLSPSNLTKQGSISQKTNDPVPGDPDKLRVKVVANTTNWIDSHMDMLLPGSYTKSINERKSVIPHLHDHEHKIAAKVGEVVDIFAQTLSFAELGISGSGSTESLIFITDVIKSYNEKVFNQYKMGRVNQHSIGLQYVKIDLAINDETSEKEFDFWNKYIDQAINKEVAIEAGFFWVVQEIKLIENSAVLFGSNIITPTLDNDLQKNEPAGSHSDNNDGASDEDVKTLTPSNTYGKLLDNIKF